jgi:hypothetical protein
MEYLYLKNRYKILFSFTVMFALIFYVGIIHAQEFSPEEALQWGVQHNRDLQNLRYSIKDLQLNLEILEAQKIFRLI